MEAYKIEYGTKVIVTEEAIMVGLCVDFLTT